MKKGIKKVKNNKKKKVIICASLILVIGITGFIFFKMRGEYYNGYRTKCSSGDYYLDTFLGLFGRGCRKCPPGQYCPGNDKRYLCEEGHYCVNGYKYSCAIGTYQDEKGKTTCKKCSTDNSKTTRQTGSVFPSSCINVETPSAPTTSVACPLGQYRSNNQCYYCPKCNGNITCFSATYNAQSVNRCLGSVPAGKYISCNMGGCTVRDCTGNTYSKSSTVYFSSTLRTTCTTCPKGQRANSTHTGCY